MAPVDEDFAMKKTVTKEIITCDTCGAEIGYDRSCLNCGVSLCYQCTQGGKHGVEYPHAVCFTGHGDGIYCLSCDAKLKASGTDARHKAYMAVTTLKVEYQQWGEDFTKRREKAEKHLNQFIKH